MVIDVGPTATPHKSQTHDNIIVYRMSGRKDVEEKQPVNDADGAGAGRRVIEMESARKKKAERQCASSPKAERSVIFPRLLL